MTQLAALHAKISGDASGFVKATNTAGAAADKLTTKVAGGGAGGVAGATTRMSGAFTKLSGSNAMRMLPMQFSQVAQQAAAGGGVMRALTIQAADIGLAFGTMGTLIGIAATIAMPLIMNAFADGADAAEDLEEGLQSIKDLSSSLHSTLDILSMSAEDLGDTFGAGADEARRFAIRLAELQYQQAIVALKELDVELDKVGKRFVDAGTKSGYLARDLQGYAELLEISKDEVKELAVALKALQEADGIEAQVAASNALHAVLKRVGVTADQLGEGVLDVQAALQRAGLEGLELERVMALVANEAERAARAAEVFGNTMGPVNPGALLEWGAESLLPPVGARGIKPESGGSGQSKEEIERAKTKAKLERLQDEFKNELELEAQHYAQQQELLQTALDAELLTRAEYDSLNEKAKKAHLDKMASIDAYAHGSTMQKTDKFLGDMATALGTGNSKMLEISKKFGAAQALISAWQGAAEALKKPWPLNLTAFAQVLGQGMAAVAAIKGVNAGGTTSGTADGGGDVAAAEPASIAQQRSLTLIGDRFNRQQAVSIAEFMNEGTDDGLVIRGAR